MISKSIKKQITDAMKAKNEIRLSTLRMLSAELHNAEIDNKREELSKEQELIVVKKEAKKRKDAIEAYKKAGNDQKAATEQKELEILQEFLPEEMSDEALGKLVDEAISESGAKSTEEMGKVMSAAMKKVAGQVGGDRVSAVVRKKLS